MSTSTTTPKTYTLTDISNTLFNYENNAAIIVQQQQNLLNLLQGESNYLTEKQTAIQNIQTMNGRTVSFNQNFSNRFLDYIQMVVVLAIGLGILMVIITLNKMDTISNTLATILSIAVVSIFIIIMFNFYVKIISRDNMDYNKMKTTPPPDSVFRDPNLMNSKNILTQVCIGENCCTDGTSYDKKNQVCVGKTKSETFVPDKNNNISAADITKFVNTHVNKATEPFSSFIGPSYTTF